MARTVEERRKGRGPRKHETRTPKPNSYLIVTEGTCTEPNYFRGMAEHIKSRLGGRIDVEDPTIDTRGEGKGTTSLVRRAQQLESQKPFFYNQVWVVFDKDDFEDFDEAIALAEKNGYRAAWSNEAFEYWLCLHFDYLDCALHRSVLKNKLTEIFKARGLGPGYYHKNIKELFVLVTQNKGLQRAISHARQTEDRWCNGEKCSERNPCTTVHHLLLEMSDYLEDLL